MKKVFIIANWKSNKNSIEANTWLVQVANSELGSVEEKEIVVCPPFTLLAQTKSYIDEKRLSIMVGAQDVSPFGVGEHTGEINAKQIKEFASYIIIGHSERRNNFGETDELLAKKADQALQSGLMPIYCIQNENTNIPKGVSMVAYEPMGAIGTGNPDTPENAERVGGFVIQKYPNITVFLYGGSITSENIASYVKMEHIGGVLVGGASLDSYKFTDLIKNASV